MAQRFRRSAWWLALLVLACWPLRASLVSGDIPGAGPDVLSTLWGMWWFGQEWTGAAWGGWTGLANAGFDASGSSYGAYGAVLSPLSALVWNLVEPIVGIGRAAALVGVLQLGGLAVAAGWLTRDLGGSRLAAFVTGVGVLGLSQSYFGLAEGSVVAVSNLFLPLGIVALRRRSLWAAACMLGLSLENPYLAPVLPAWGFVLWLRAGWNWKRGEDSADWFSISRILAAGVMAIVGVALLFGGAASDEYPTRLGEHFVSFLGASLEVVEQPWARVGWNEWFLPGNRSWTLDHTQGEGAAGDGYIGLMLLALGLAALVWEGRRSGPYLGLAAVGLVLSLGSVAGGVVMPFALLNSVMDQVARPLTQPSRFLALVGLGLGVGAGLASDYARQRWRPEVAWGLAALLLVDGLVWGGLSLRLPSTTVPQGDCVASLAEEPEGIVVLWPEDGSRYEGDLGRTWLLQMIHEQPSVHPGIASWRLHQGRSRDRLRNDLGFTYMAPIGEAMGQPTGRPDVSGMMQMGIDWVVVDLNRDPGQSDWARAQFGTPIRECEGYQIHRLGESP